MQKLPQLALAFILVLAPAGPPAIAIVGGEEDTNYEYPYVGQVLFDYPELGGLTQGCSGYLIHERIVVTAGHCWPGSDALQLRPYWVSFSLNSLDAPESWIPVSEWYRHPAYDPEYPAIANPDVALIILAEPVTSIAPVSLPPVGYVDDLWADGILRPEGERPLLTVVGYGASATDPPEPAWDFTVAGTRHFATTEYRSHTRDHVLGSQRDDGGICKQDSGSPLLYTDENGVRSAVGTASWADTWCGATAWWVRMDTDEIMDWIQDVISGL